MAEGKGVEPLTVTSPRFSGPVAGLPSGTLHNRGGGNRDRTYALSSGLGLASRHITALSALRDHRDEVLDDESLRMGELYRVGRLNGRAPDCKSEVGLFRGGSNPPQPTTSNRKGDA